MKKRTRPAPQWLSIKIIAKTTICLKKLQGKFQPHSQFRFPISASLIVKIRNSHSMLIAVGRWPQSALGNFVVTVMPRCLRTYVNTCKRNRTSFDMNYLGISLLQYRHLFDWFLINHIDLLTSRREKDTLKQR